jgi:hypothetical protein
MKAYLIVSGTVFGLFGIAHMIEVGQSWRELTTNLGFLLHSISILAISGILSVWAWRLQRTIAR